MYSPLCFGSFLFAVFSEARDISRMLIDGHEFWLLVHFPQSEQTAAPVRARRDRK
jgi:hypothetical protein